jgi:hypothetical protein
MHTRTLGAMRPTRSELRADAYAKNIGVVEISSLAIVKATARKERDGRSRKNRCLPADLTCYTSHSISSTSYSSVIRTAISSRQGSRGALEVRSLLSSAANTSGIRAGRPSRWRVGDMIARDILHRSGSTELPHPAEGWPLRQRLFPCHVGWTKCRHCASSRRRL